MLVCVPPVIATMWETLRSPEDTACRMRSRVGSDSIAKYRDTIHGIEHRGHGIHRASPPCS